MTILSILRPTAAIFLIASGTAAASAISTSESGLKASASNPPVNHELRLAQRPERNADAPLRPERNADSPLRPERNADSPLRPERNADAPLRPERNEEAPLRPERNADSPLK